jgi:phospholipase/lecithinase/hemolysin
MRSQAATLPALLVDPTGLYAVFGGANDIGDALGSATPVADLATSAGNIASIVSDLYELGARRFLRAGGTGREVRDALFLRQHGDGDLLAAGRSGLRR